MRMHPAQRPHLDVLLKCVRSHLRSARGQPATAAAARATHERSKAERVGTVGDTGLCHCACRARARLCTIAAPIACTTLATIAAAATATATAIAIAAAAAAAAAARGARKLLVQPAGVSDCNSTAHDRALSRARQCQLLPRLEQP